MSIHSQNFVAQRHAQFDFTEDEIIKIAGRRPFIVSRHAPDQAKLRGQVYHMHKHGKLKLIGYDGRVFKYRSIEHDQNENHPAAD